MTHENDESPKLEGELDITDAKYYVLKIHNQEHNQRIDRRPNLEYRPSDLELTTYNTTNNEESLDEPERQGSIIDTKIGLTFKNPSKNLWRVIAACMWAFTAGFSDGSTGVFLPSIEEQYNISYSIVSLVWMANAVGYIMVASLAHKIHLWFGKQKSIVIGCFFSSIMFTLVSTGSIFPIIVAGFFFGGVGTGTCLSQLNVFVSRFEKSSTTLGYFHGSYGLGASVSPLIATLFVEKGIRWNFFYLILLGFMVSNVACTFFAFENVDKDLKPWDHAEEIDSNINDQEVTIIKSSIIKDVLSSRITWLTSFFVLFYQGGEVAIGGWFVTYLRDYRHNKSASVGYVSSGYWFGLTFGRLVLTRLFHKYMGARRGNIVLSIFSIVCISLTWALSNVIAEGFFVSIAGICIGPVYPLMITLVAPLLPRKIQIVSLTITTAFGSSGGALFPFFIGLVSQYVGTFVVLPSFIILFSIMLILWLCLPNIENKRVRKDNLEFFKRIW